MYDEQARLIDNLSEFISYADSQNADYQMGVIVTDSRSSNAGKLEFCYPHPRIIRHDYAQREEAFRCLFEVGVTGSYIEAGWALQCEHFKERCVLTMILSVILTLGFFEMTRVSPL